MNLALVLIDIQNDYFPEGKREVKGALAAADNAKKLLSACRQQGLPCIHVQHVSAYQGATFFLPYTEGINFHNSVLPTENELIIQKYYPNSFRQTDLDARLAALGIKQLIICGMMSQMCVEATARAAFDKEYQCIVAHDACAAAELSFNGMDIPAEYVHASVMATLGAVYAEVASTDSIINQTIIKATL